MEATPPAMVTEAQTGSLTDRPIREYGMDGSIIYHEPDTASMRLGRKINALFAEGLFQSVTSERLEEQVSAPPVHESDGHGDAIDDVGAQGSHDGPGIKEEAAPASKGVTVGGQLSYDEMAQLKAEMDARLVSAYFEINSIQELCQSLLPSTTAPPFPSQPFPYIQESGSIPLSALSMTMASSISSYRIRVIQDGNMAIGRNRKGLVECRRAVEEGARRLKLEVGRGKEGYWSVLGGLAGTARSPNADGQEEQEKKDETMSIDGDQPGVHLHSNRRWAMSPRWLADGTPEAKQLARDVMIPYAADEAAPLVRRRAIAFINPKLDPASTDKEDALIFPGRRHRRLRITLRSLEGISRSRLISPDKTGVEGNDDTTIISTTAETLSRSLEEAQAEAFDEEVYEGIVREARAPNVWDAAVTMDRIVLRPVAGVELRFEMINTDEEEDEDDERGTPQLSTSRATLLLSVLRLRMLHIYRIRRSEQPKTADPQIATKLTPSTPAPPSRNILSPVIAYIRYQAFVEQITSILTRCQTAVRSLGLDLTIEREDGHEAGGMDWISLIGGEDVRAEGDQKQAPGGSVDVVLDGRQIVSILASTSCQLTLIFPHVTLVSQDIAQLPTYLLPEMQKGIIRSVRDAVADDRTNLGDELRKFVVDEGLGTITTRNVKFRFEAITEKLNFRAKAFKIVRGTQEKTAGTVEELEFASGKGTDIRSWAISMLT